MTADSAREMYHQNYGLLEGGILMLAADGAEQVIFASRPAAGLYECDSEEEFLTFISSRFQNMMVPEDYKPVKEIVNPETGRFHITFHYLTRQKHFRKAEAVGSPRDTAFGRVYLIELFSDEQIAEAVAAAKIAKAAVVFAGLPDVYESEGYDRTHMRLPDCQNRLIEAVADANPNTVVVLHNGSPVEMPWIGKVKAVLEAYLGGQAVGLAEVRVLFGDVNPSGHLPETFPVKLADNPSYLFYGGEGNVAEYREGIFVGYRYYDKKEAEVLFPFGHGLSYTSFAYSDLRLSASQITDRDTLTASVRGSRERARGGAANLSRISPGPTRGKSTSRSSAKHSIRAPSWGAKRAEKTLEKAWSNRRPQQPVTTTSPPDRARAN